MDEDPTTEELQLAQLQREKAERQIAERVGRDGGEDHERRADKAAYLREKLEERAESERAGEERS